MGKRREKALGAGTGRAGGSETRERVMNVAEFHLAERGYMGVSLEEVAKGVGVSKPALYYHFPEGKEELFVAIAHRALRHHHEGLERVMASAKDGAGKLREVARWLMAELDKGHPMRELQDLARFVEERHRVELAEDFYSSLYGPIRRAISSAIESGEFRKSDPDFLSWAFLSLLSGMLDVKRVSSGPPVPKAALSAEGIADQTVELFLKGVL